jgi:hypothetical protein
MLMARGYFWGFALHICPFFILNGAPIQYLSGAQIVARSDGESATAIELRD